MSKVTEFLLSKLFMVAFMLPILILNMINYFIYNLGSDSFVLVAPLKYVGKPKENKWVWENEIHRSALLRRLPFDWQTPYTFPIAFAFFTVGTYASFVSLLPIEIFFIGSFLLFMAFLKDISSDLNHLNELLKGKKVQMERKQLLYKIIKNFSSVKRLSIWNWIDYYEFNVTFYEPFFPMQIFQSIQWNLWV